MPHDDAPEVMNVRQAAAYLGVSADTLYKHLSEGTIPAFRLGQRWRFKKSVLDGWMEGQSGAPRPPAREAGRLPARHRQG